MSILGDIARDLIGTQAPAGFGFADLLKEAAVDGARRIGYEQLAKAMDCCKFEVIDDDRVEVTIPQLLPMRFHHPNVEKALAVHGYTDWPVFVRVTE